MQKLESIRVSPGLGILRRIGQSRSVLLRATMPAVQTGEEARKLKASRPTRTGMPPMNVGIRGCQLARLFTSRVQQRTVMVERRCPAKPHSGMDGLPHEGTHS